MQPSYMAEMTDSEKIERLQNELIECARRCAGGGGLIFAIKAYRAATGASLKESKELLEKLIPASFEDARIQRLEDRVSGIERRLTPGLAELQTL